MKKFLSFNKKEFNSLKVVFVSLVLVFSIISGLVFGGDTKNKLVFFGEEFYFEDFVPFPRILVEKSSVANNALFDIRVIVPQKHKMISYGEDLIVNVDLFNLGEEGSVEVELSYIVTNKDGNIVFIEHEKLVVETQLSFFKLLELQLFEFGDYKLFTELLYSNTSAFSTEEFSVGY